MVWERERERERAVEKHVISLETISLVEYILSWNKNSATLPFLDNMYDRYSRGQYIFTGRDSRWKMPPCAPQSMDSSVVFSPVGVLSYTRKHTHAHSLRAPARAHADQWSYTGPIQFSLIVKSSLFCQSIMVKRVCLHFICPKISSIFIQRVAIQIWAIDIGHTVNFNSHRRSFYEPLCQ